MDMNSQSNVRATTPSICKFFKFFERSNYQLTRVLIYVFYSIHISSTYYRKNNYEGWYIQKWFKAWIHLEESLYYLFGKYSPTTHNIKWKQKYTFPLCFVQWEIRVNLKQTNIDNNKAILKQPTTI